MTEQNSKRQAIAAVIAENMIAKMTK